MSRHRALAPAKVNLGLFIGATRPADRRHELVTVMQSISLADQLTLEPAGPDAGADHVICPGVDGPPEQNLALRALLAFRRQTGWDAPPQQLHIDKRIPVAAGLGGGSADAAAALRLAHHASGLGDHELLLDIARQLGADVPAQVSPGSWLAGGAGELLEPLRAPRHRFALLVLPFAGALSTAAVYEEADRLAIARSRHSLDAIHAALAEDWRDGLPELGAASSSASGVGLDLLHNDLQQPAILLCPGILDLLARARACAAERVFVSGSGPTVLALFTRQTARPPGERDSDSGDRPLAHSGSDAHSGDAQAGAEARAGAEDPPGGEDRAGGGGTPAERAREAAESLSRLVPAPCWAEPVDAQFGRAWTEDASDPPGDGTLRHNPGETTDE